jgi:CRP-like cAMP-binding protein
MTTASSPPGTLSRDMHALLLKATEQALRAVQRAALTVRTRVRSMDDLAGLRVLVQAVVNLQKPLSALRSPPQAAAFDADGAVRHLATGAADLLKRVQQVLLALYKAELKLAHALAFLRAPDAALSDEPDRLVAIGTLARAVLSEFQAVPKTMLVKLPPSASSSDVASAAPPPLPPASQAVDDDDVDADADGNGNDDDDDDDHHRHNDAPPPLPPAEFVPASAFTTSLDVSASLAASDIKRLPLHLSSSPFLSSETAPGSPTGAVELNNRNALSSMLLLLSDALALPRAEVEKLLRVASDPTDLQASVTLDAVLRSANSAVASLSMRDVQRQVHTADQQRKARDAELARCLSDGADALFGKPWPFDEPDSDDNVLWITTQAPAAAAAAGAGASASSDGVGGERRGSLPGRVASFSAKVKPLGHSSNSPLLAPRGGGERQVSVLRAATLQKLLDYVVPTVRDAKVDAALLPVFFVTYHTFAPRRDAQPLDGATLLAVLMRRYRGPRDTASGGAQSVFEAHKASVRGAVADALYTWIERNPHCFFADDEFLGRAVQSFLRQAAENNKAPAAARLKQAAALLERQRLLLGVKPATGRTGGDLSLAALAAVDVTQLCQEWCLMEFELFRQIAPREFLRQAWNKSGKATLAPNMLAYIDVFNTMSRWVQTTVLQGATPGERAATIAFFVECGEKLAALNNFNALMEILSALNGSAIFRLKRSWMQLPASVVARFEQLNERMSPSLNYKRYRADLAACQARGDTYLAFMGVTHTDLTFSDDANEDWVGDGARLNVEKALLVGQAILACVDGLRQTYAFGTRRDVRALLLSGSVWDENEIYRISMLKEDRLTDKEKAELESSGRRTARVAELSHVGVGQQRQVDTRSRLTDKDWTVLTALGALETHQAGDCVVNAGAALDRWLRLRAGALRVEVQIDNAWQVVRELSDGAQFGVAEALLSPAVSNQTLFRCVCTQRTELWQIRRGAVLPLLEADALLSQRFWLHVAQLLVEHLKALPFSRALALQQLSANAAARPGALSAAPAAPVASRRRSLRDANKGGRPKIEAELAESALASYACHVQHRIDSKGTLFVLKSRLVLLSTLFGVPRTRKLLFSEVSALVLDETGNRITLRTSDGDETVLHRFRDAKAAAVLSMIDAVRIAAVGAPPDDALARRNTLATASDDGGSLTSDDWELLTKGAKRLKFARDDAVVREGDVYQRLYQITAGTCRVQARSGVVLAKMNEGELFGEMSFVQRMQTGASATVLADADEVEVIVLEGYFINTAIQLRDGFGGRFFRYVASVLAERIQKREQLVYDEAFNEGDD